jgi:hypothetical protein
LSSPFFQNTIFSLVIDNPASPTTLPQTAATGLVVRGGDVVFAQACRPAAWECRPGQARRWRGTAGRPTRLHRSRLIRLAGQLVWISGEFSGPGQLLIIPNAYLDMTGLYPFGGGDHRLTRRTINYGFIEWHDDPTNGGTFTLSAELVNRGTLTLGGYGFVSTTAGLGPGSAPGYITNFGTSQRHGCHHPPRRRGGVHFNNQGTVRVDSYIFGAAAGLTLQRGRCRGWELVHRVPGRDRLWRLWQRSEQCLFLGDREGAPGRGGAMDQSDLCRGRGQMVGELIVTVPGRLTLLGAATSITCTAFTNNGAVTLADGLVNLNARVVNNGELAVNAGQLSIGGDLTLGPTSILRVSSTASTSPPRVVVSGAATLAGSLAVTFTWLRRWGPSMTSSRWARTEPADSARSSGLGMPPAGTLIFQYVGASTGVWPSSWSDRPVVRRAPLPGRDRTGQPGDRLNARPHSGQRGSRRPDRP